MITRFAALVLAVLMVAGLAIGQSPLQKVRLWDTNLSHNLTLTWNENDTAARTLNFLVAGATRSLTISEDSYIDQDVRIAATPTWASAILNKATGDQVLQFSLAGTAKWTAGLDDSDSDNWKLANASALGTAMSNSFAFGETLYYGHGLDNIHGVLLSDFATDATYIAGGIGSADGQFDYPRQIAYDGKYLYIADDINNRAQMFLASTGAFVGKTAAGDIARPWGCAFWNGSLYVTRSSGAGNKVVEFDAETLVLKTSWGAAGAGDTQFNGPRSLTTDGAYLYICDTGNTRVKKHTLAGAYVAQVGSAGTGNGEFGGGTGPVGIATDGTYLYVTDYGNQRVQIFLCSDLSYFAQVAMQNLPTIGPGSPTAVTLNGTYFYVNCVNSLPHAAYIEKYDIATRTFQATFEGAGNSDQSYGSIILKAPISHGDLLVVHEDGSYFDIYPKTRFFNDIRLFEGNVPTGDYVGFRAPADVTSSFHFTLPAAPNTVKSSLYAAAGAVLSFGQNVDSDASPSFVRATLTQATGTSPFAITSTTVNTNLNADLWDGLHVPALDNGKFLTNNGTTFSWAAAVGAPASAKYIVQEATVDLSAEQSLGALATGIIKNTTTAGVGVLSIASGADLPAHSHAFAGLTDVPADYVGAGGKVVKVKADASGLEFVAGGAGVTNFTDLGDVPANYAGQAGLYAKVKATEDGLEFAAAAGAAVSTTTITATGATNWTKVAGARWCLVRIWGAGGSGARAVNGNAGGGGGGGGYIEKIFAYADLTDTVSVTIGAGGAAVTVDDTVGNAGGNTTFGAYLTAYGGGGGSHATTLFGGGGGGGAASVGAVGSGTAGGTGGGPAGGWYTASTGATRNSSFGGGSGGAAGPIAAGDSAWGGGGGGGGTATTGNGPGGSSLYGGGGGGGGSDTGTPSAGGASVFGGAGGAGAKDGAAATAGTQPGGGGGGSEAADSGKGGDGKAVIISF